MANIKDIFKITFALQILVCTFATYGHPDAELIDFGSPTQPSRDELIIESAIKRGMDGEAVAELLRTRNPVVRTTTTPEGFNKTTTYKLEPDGSISSKSIIQKRHRYTYNSQAVPDILKNLPKEIVTKTYTDSDGNKVTHTFSATHYNPSSGVNTDDLSGDWYNNPFPFWPKETSSSPAHTTVHRTRTSYTPSGEKRTVQSGSSNSEFPEPKTAFTLTNDTPNLRRTSTKTYSTPIEEKRLTQTTSTNSHSFNVPNEPKFSHTDDLNWDNYGSSTFSHSWDNAEPDALDDWEELKDTEITTKRNSKTWDRPQFPTHPSAPTTTVKPKLTNGKPLLNLNDFLRSQYEGSANREPITTTPKPPITTPKIIKIEDLPVAEVLYNGKPASESILKTLPPHLTPRTPTEHVINIINKHPIEENTDFYTHKGDTNIRSYSKTHVGSDKPKLRDLDPEMQNILKNAGIVPEIEGDSITKTRTEPDGRIITTTYKVNTVESAPAQTFVQSTQSTTPTLNSYSRDVPRSSIMRRGSSISEFLAKLGLTKSDITSSLHEPYSEVFFDDNGDILTVTFKLRGPIKPIPAWSS